MMAKYGLLSSLIWPYYLKLNWLTKFNALGLGLGFNLIKIRSQHWLRGDYKTADSK